MSEKKLEITIKPNGEMDIETIDIKGAATCTKIIENVLIGVGGKKAISDIKKKSDFWQDDRKVFTNI